MKNRQQYKKYIVPWRKRNPDKRRASRQRHYDKTKVVTEKTKRRPTGVPHRPWPNEEISIIIDPICHALFTDRETSKALNRSVHAIQQKRYQLKRR